MAFEGDRSYVPSEQRSVEGKKDKFGRQVEYIGKVIDSWRHEFEESGGQEGIDEETADILENVFETARRDLAESEENLAELGVRNFGGVMKKRLEEAVSNMVLPEGFDRQFWLRVKKENDRRAEAWQKETERSMEKGAREAGDSEREYSHTSEKGVEENIADSGDQGGEAANKSEIPDGVGMFRLENFSEKAPDFEILSDDEQERSAIAMFEVLNELSDEEGVNLKDQNIFKEVFYSIMTDAKKRKLDFTFQWNCLDRLKDRLAKGEISEESHSDFIHRWTQKNEEKRDEENSALSRKVLKDWFESGSLKKDKASVLSSMILSAEAEAKKRGVDNFRDVELEMMNELLHENQFSRKIYDEYWRRVNEARNLREIERKKNRERRKRNRREG